MILKYKVYYIIMNEICNICLEDLNYNNLKEFKLLCNHSFHEDCINEWFSTILKQICPICKERNYIFSSTLELNYNNKYKLKTIIDKIENVIELLKYHNIYNIKGIQEIKFICNNDYLIITNIILKENYTNNDVIINSIINDIISLIINNNVSEEAEIILIIILNEINKFNNSLDNSLDKLIFFIKYLLYLTIILTVIIIIFILCNNS